MEAERRSTRAVADSGIELTDVPPEITPILNVVRGESGIWTSLNRASARERSTMGLGTPKSLHEWPPGPRTRIWEWQSLPLRLTPEACSNHRLFEATSYIDGRRNVRVFVPPGTSIVLSILATFVLNLFLRR